MQQAQLAQQHQPQSLPIPEERVERTPSDASQQNQGYPQALTSNRLTTPLGVKGSRDGSLGPLAAGVSALKVSGAVARGGESPERFSAASSRTSHSQVRELNPKP